MAKRRGRTWSGLNISVLILEDDRELAECTADYLRSYGLKAKFAADVQEFEEAREKETFDILLLDIMLGGTSGLALCHKIRETSDIPIIFLTALGEEADIVLGLEMGADDYLVKPFSCRELLARINRIMRRVRKDKAQALPPELALNIPEPGGPFSSSGTGCWTRRRICCWTEREWRIISVIPNNVHSAFSAPPSA